jgi:hypothetical protein
VAARRVNNRCPDNGRSHLEPRPARTPNLGIFPSAPASFPIDPSRRRA